MSKETRARCDELKAALAVKTHTDELDAVLTELEAKLDKWEPKKLEVEEGVLRELVQSNLTAIELLKQLQKRVEELEADSMRNYRWHNS